MNRTAIVLVAALFAGPAFAAESVGSLSAQEGTVLVNQGEEFVTAADAQALKPGDRVMVMEGGSAAITFADGCVLPVQAGSLTIVPAQSTCSGAVAKTQTVGASYAQAVGDDDTQTDGEKLFKAAVIGGTLLAMALIMHDDEDDDEDEVPVSP